MRRRLDARDSSLKSSPSASDPPETSEDALFSGALVLSQPRRGYRFNADSLFLADFVAGARPRARRVVDLGAGVGAVGLVLSHLRVARRVELVERDPLLAELARRNLARLGVEGAVHIADLAAAGLPEVLRGEADVVVTNPPFFARPHSREASEPGRRSARHGPLAPFTRAAAAALGRRAAAFFAYPAAELPELLAEARAAGLVAKRVRFVHAFASAPARLALLELRRAKPGGLVVAPPLVEWSAKGVRSAAVEAILAGRASAPERAS